jgi:hypothetical protein
MFTSTSTKTATAAVTTSSPTKATPATSLPAGTDSQKSVCEFYRFGKCNYGGSCRYLHPGYHASNNATWRASSNDQQSDTNGPLRDLNLLPKKEDVLEGHVAVNKNNFRLDPYAPSSPEADMRLKARINIKRICNSFHLNGSCDEHCGYDHSPLEAELKRALESLARSQPCPRRGGCRRGDCTHGHVCQNPDCKHRGGKAFYKLPYASHNEDLAVAAYVPAASKPPHSRQVSYVDDSTTGGSDDEDGPQSISVSPAWREEEEEEKYSFNGSNGALVEGDDASK